MTEHQLTPGDLARRAGVAMAFIRMSQRLGIPLANVAEALATLPADRVPTSRG